MARLWSCGFELRSATAAVEWDTNNGTPAISTTTVRSGGAALRCNPAAATTYVQHRFQADTLNRTFHRFYLRIASAPSVNTVIFRYGDGTANPCAMQLTTGRTLQMWNDTAAVGTVSSALALDTWYRVEIDFTDSATTGTGIGYLDGVNFSGSCAITGVNAGGVVRIGPQTACTTDLFFDDVAVNDTAGTVQNGLPGDGSIVHLYPGAAGDTNGFATAVGGTAGAANNFTRVDEVTPDDATTYNQTTATGTTLTDEFSCQSAASAGIGASDTVTLVAVGSRIGSSATTAANLHVRIKGQAGGTTTKSAAITCNTVAFNTHKSTTPRVHQLTAYTNPQTSTAWTPSTLDTMQIGYGQQTSQTTQRRVTTVWALVEYVPSAAGPDQTITAAGLPCQGAHGVAAVAPGPVTISPVGGNDSTGAGTAVVSTSGGPLQTITAAGCNGSTGAGAALVAATTISPVGGLVSTTGAALTGLAVTASAVGNAWLFYVKTGGNTVSVASVSGGGASSWTRLAGPFVDGNGNPATHEIWMGVIDTPGAGTITPTWSGPTTGVSIDLDAHEFTSSIGAVAAWSADGAGGTLDNATSTTVTYPALTASGSAELYFGHSRVPNTTLGGTTPGFTYVTDANGNGITYSVMASGAVQPIGTQNVPGTSHTIAALVQATVAAQPITAAGLNGASGSGVAAVTRGAVAVSAAGLRSADAAGVATVARGVYTVQAVGFGAESRSGAANVAAGVVTLGATGSGGSGQAGTAIVVPGPVAVAAAGLNGSGSSGVASVAIGAATIVAVGAGSDSRSGVAAVTAGTTTLVASGVDARGGSGAAVVLPGPVTVTAAGFDGTSGAGTASVATGGTLLVAAGLPADSRSGVAGVTAGTTTLVAAGLRSGEASGVATMVPGPVTVSAAGLAGTAGAGTASIAIGGTLLGPVAGLPGGERAGVAAITTSAAISATGSPSGETWGIHSVNQTLTVSGARAGDAAGVAAVGQLVAAVGLPTVAMAARAIVTAGTATIGATGLPSAHGAGAAVVAAGAVALTAYGLRSDERAGFVTVTANELGYLIHPGGLPSGEAAGVAAVYTRWTERPGGGSTSRPTGWTDRPTSGSTARVTGWTDRPTSGTTPRP